MTAINEIFVNKTAFESPEFSMPVGGSPHADMWVGVTGPGPVYIDVLGKDGVWRTYPEFTINGPSAQLLNVKRGRFKVRVAAATPTTVEVLA
ncbi:MAG TPA: hypothetical protein VIZ86_16690 [Pseudomonas sp.]